MAQADRKSSTSLLYETRLQTLEASIEKLTQHSKQHLQAKYGLSEGLRKQCQTEGQAMVLCERAMETLATEYVDKLVLFRESPEPMSALQALDDAEAIWQAETTILKHLDPDGKETEFLKEMRAHAYQVLVQRLETAADRCKRQASDENVALCLGILATLDAQLGELGQPVHGAERQKWRQLAAEFQ